MAETKRPTSAAAEEILGGYFPVLDHGFVSLVDYMGTDEDIERAARVSYGYGTRKRSATRGLIRYLRRHAHTTPSEMVEFKFHCSMPIFVARQWVRHRTACLAEGTEVYFDLPGGVDRRGNLLYKLPIEELWSRFAPTRNVTRPDQQRYPYFKRERVQGMLLRQVNEDTLDIQHTRIVDVMCNGKKHVFRVTLADGKSIEATSDHRFLFADGWGTLKQAIGLEESDGLAIWNQGDHYLYANGVVMEEPALYRERSWLRERSHELEMSVPDMADEAGVSYATIRKWPRKHGLQRPYRFEPERAGELHAHHIVPVWADKSLAREEANLTTLCGHCHRSVAGREEDFAEQLLDEPIHTEWKRRPRVAWNKHTKARLVRIDRVEYVGIKQTYDLQVVGPHHNFIANGIVTHNSVNEYSGRYSLMPLLFYEPPAGSFALQSSSNNQGRQERPAEASLYAEAITRWERLRAEAADTYGWLVQEDVAREIARIDLPLSTYTQWYWKIDLHNLLHFLRLRVDPHAQWEIQEYGRVMAGMLERVAPLSYEAWLDYEVLGARMSAAELDVLRRLLEADGDGGIAARSGGGLDADALSTAGLSGREARELLAKLEPGERPDFTLDLSAMQSAARMAEHTAEAVPETPA